jgi:hypothetical protein
MKLRQLPLLLVRQTWVFRDSALSKIPQLLRTFLWIPVKVRVRVKAVVKVRVKAVVKVKGAAAKVKGAAAKAERVAVVKVEKAGAEAAKVVGPRAVPFASSTSPIC